MTRTMGRTAAALGAAFLALPGRGLARQDEAKEHGELAQAMKQVDVSLERGESAAGAHEGRPISGGAGEVHPLRRRTPCKRCA